jgi:hypothetical protein
MSSESSQSSPLFCRAWFGAMLVAICAVLSVTFFLFENAREPEAPMDYWFKVRLFSGVGGATGALAWFISRLVASNRIGMWAVVVLLALPWCFLTFVAADKNPFFATAASLIFGFVLFMALLGFLTSRAPAKK